MIVGEVTAQREAVVSVKVFGGNGEMDIDAVIDTGFTDYLTLPKKHIDELGLPFLDVSRALLADGTTAAFEVYKGAVLWEGARKDIQIHAADGGPLLGMSILYGCTLAIEVVDGGSVTIEAV